MIRIKTTFVTGALGAAILMMPLIASAEIYRYDDKDGHRHAVGSLGQVPPEFREAAIADAQTRSGGTVNVIEVMDSSGSAPPAAVVAEPTRSSPAAASATEPTSLGGHDRYWWQSQMQEKQQWIEDLRGQIEFAKEEEENFSDQIYRKPGAGGRDTSRFGGRNVGRAALLSAADDHEEEPSVEQLEGELAEAESDLEQLEDRARRAGVPPGWLR